MKFSLRWIVLSLAVVCVAAFWAPKSWFCRHVIAWSNVTQEPTCCEEGRLDVVCANCGKVLESHEMKRTAHSFGEYKIVKFARGDRSGVEARTCAVCQAVEERKYRCLHRMKYENVDFAPTCTESGIGSTVCRACRGVLEVKCLDAAGHSFGEYALTVLPTADTNGVETRVCYVCAEKEEREYICPHEHTDVSVTKKATCSQEGEQVNICELCGKTVNKKSLSKTGCKYGSWKYAKKATPNSKGERYKECSCCGKKKTEVYSFSLAGKNSLYIPGTGINHKLAITSFSQASVDKYNIVYARSGAEYGINRNFILGHKAGTMSKLHKTKNGQYLYVSINGNEETYKVVVSEYALQNNSKTDIIGRTAGSSMWDSTESKTLCLYTCYGSNKNGRWLVLAKKV